MSNQTASNNQRRGRAVAGALVGALVLVVLAVVFFVVRSGDDDQPTAAASTPVAEQTSAAAPETVQPSAEASAPAPAGVPAELAKEPEVTKGAGTLSKLVVTELVAGKGPAVKAGQTVTVNYKLVSYDKGEVLDSSWGRGQPFSTPIGVGQVIAGWDQGIPGQKVGSRIQLDVPKALAYPSRPDMNDLRFVVDILDAR